MEVPPANKEDSQEKVWSLTGGRRIKQGCDDGVNATTSSPAGQGNGRTNDENSGNSECVSQNEISGVDLLPKNPRTIGTSELSSRGTDDLSSLTPLMKILPPVKLNLNKLFDKVTFCLKLIKNNENYDDLKNTIIQRGGAVVDTLTDETDMLLVEYDIGMPEVIDKLPNVPSASNIDDRAIIASAVSKNVTVATDIYVWQCILNSDLVPTDDFELIRGMEDRLPGATGKKIVSGATPSYGPPQPPPEPPGLSISSLGKFYQQKICSDGRVQQDPSLISSYTGSHRSNRNPRKRSSGPDILPNRRQSATGDFSSECNSSDDDLCQPNPTQGAHYAPHASLDAAEKNNLKVLGPPGFSTATQDLMSGYSVKSISDYYRLMNSHSRSYGIHRASSTVSPGSLNSHDKSSSPSHNIQIINNTLQQRTPSHHRNQVFSNETDYTHQSTPFSSLGKCTPMPIINARLDDSYDNLIIDSPIAYHPSDHSSVLEELTEDIPTSKGHRNSGAPDMMFESRNGAGLKSEFQMERLGWSAMFRSVLVSDFIRTEGRRLLSSTNAESPKPDPGDRIWLEIRANLHGLSVEEELKMVESQRTRMGLVLEEVCGASFADTTDLNVYDQATDLLERVSHFKSLYPSLKVLKMKNPAFQNPQLQRRLDALAAWINIKNSIVHHLYLINMWVQSKQWPAKRMQEFLNMNKRAELASVEIFLKEMPSIRAFEYRIINTLRKALLTIKNAISDNARTFHRMKLPIDVKGLDRLACFCSDMTIETLKMQVQLVEPFSRHGENILEQVIENFSDGLGLSIEVKELCKTVDQPSEGWLIESSLNPSFDTTILRFLKSYFSLIKQRLMEASEQVFFKEAELVESKWASMMKVRDMIECTDVEIAIQFCRLASELMNKLFVYIKHHTYQSVDINSLSLNAPSSQQDSATQNNAQFERLSKHYGRIVDNMKSRARKLLGFFRMLGMEFENCSEYAITGPVRAFIDKLAESKHVLVHTDMGYAKDVLICASGPLLKTPHKIISLLKNCPRRSNIISNDTYNYVLVISLKKCPNFGFKWKGGIVQIDVLKALRSLDMKKDTVRLVAENSGSLNNCRQRFEAVTMGLVRIIRIQKAHIESVNKELKKIREAVFKLSLAVCPLVDKVASSLTCALFDDSSLKYSSHDATHVPQQIPTGQNFEVVQEIYLFASGFALRSVRRLHKGKKRRYLQTQLFNLSLGWVEFCTNIDESDLPLSLKQETYSWHITALKFLANLANDRTVLLLNNSEFSRLKKSVSDSLTKVLKMCRSVVDVGSREKMPLDYGFDETPDKALNGISGNIEKKITRVSLKNPIVNLLNVPEIYNSFNEDPSLLYDALDAPNQGQITDVLRISKHKDLITETSVASDTADAVQDISIWDSVPNNNIIGVGEPKVGPLLSSEQLEAQGITQRYYTHQRTGAFDKIADIFPAYPQDENCSALGSTFDTYILPESDTNPAIPNDPRHALGGPSQQNRPDTTCNLKNNNVHTWQDQTKCVQQHYFGKVHKFKAIGRRFFSGVENLYMLQKKNRWRQRISELEEKVASKQRSLRIIGKMLDNTSYEDRNISLIARNSGSISMRWRQGSYIGSGSFGDVYVGTNLETGDTMAVKEIKFFDARNLEKLAKFIIEEMNVLQMLHHPNIIDYYGIEVFRDRIYIFMECCKHSLAKVLETARFDDENILKIYTKHLLKGLAYLHGNGIIHRDIKPANILFSKEGRIKYVDFGASKIFRADDNLIGYSGDTRTLVGTPQYIAPEVVNNEINHKRGSRDVWALGCCILQMFTGKSPWGDTDNDWAIMWKIGTSNDHPDIPKPPAISEQAVDFLKKCFTRPARERPTAEELMCHEWTSGVEGECPDISYIECLLAVSSERRKY